MPEGSPEKQLEGRIFDDVGMDFAWHATDLHGKILGASYHPVSSTVSAFHLDVMSCVDAGTNFFSKIVVDNNDLGPGVEDPVLCTAVTDQNLDLQEGERIYRFEVSNEGG